MGLFSYTLFYAATKKPYVSFTGVLILGGSKELRDKITHKGNPELADFLWTALGGTVGLMVTGLR
ncbi:MAG: hypothetical protein GXO39_07375 [Thermotogae bacterium]|nr:hypothetical protein [Thermotogota bacterium]